MITRRLATRYGVAIAVLAVTACTIAACSSAVPEHRNAVGAGPSAHSSGRSQHVGPTTSRGPGHPTTVGSSGHAGRTSGNSRGHAGGGSGTAGHASRAEPTVCHYPSFGTPGRIVSRPPHKPVHATSLDLSVSLGTRRHVYPIDITLEPHAAPCAVNSLAHLADAHFYDATTCDRLTTSVIFILQCGDPTGLGAGGPGYRFHDELHGRPTYPAGTVAMAEGAPNTNGSQFFIVYRTARLLPHYTVVGHVRVGMRIVRYVARHRSNNVISPGDGRPRLAVRILHAGATLLP